ncbi:MAG: bifunctional DNA-formamidopyrimidine glycosylase/DNA-(apurinic or apyrimidinic site) lyase [Candidatus Kariarchaeaceae archaeon]|jgi:formamidopyrimidine-DNA glycosylase
MPEGPEVEVVRQGLLSTCGSNIVGVRVSSNKKYTPFQSQFQSLLGTSIVNIRRRGKFLLWEFGKDASLRIGLNHLGMTGIWYLLNQTDWEKIPNPFEKFKHFKLYFHLNTGTHLIFVDVRTFGRFEMLSLNEVENHPSLKNLGPDILEEPFDINTFLIRVRGEKRIRVKAIGKLLLDGSIIAGCGNIYKSEALHRARIHPDTPANLLTDDQIITLGKNLSQVGQQALTSKGSTISDYQQVNGVSGLMQNKFRVYGRDGQACTTCRSEIKRTKQSGRSSFWCPSCQNN